MNESEVIYISIPFSDGKLCPRCKNETNVMRIATIRLRRYDVKTVMYPLRFCKECGLGFADNAMRRQFRKSYPRSNVPFVTLKDTYTNDDIRRLCFINKNELTARTKESKHITAPKTSSDQARTRVVASCGYKKESSRNLLSDQMGYYSLLIPDDFLEYVAVTLSQNKRHVLALFLSIRKRTYAFIITDYSSQKDGSIIFLDYHAEETRQLLAAILQHHNKSILYDGKEYLYLDRTVLKSSLFSCPSIIHIGRIKGKKNAGYQSRYYKLIDTLIYSPKSDRYEILKGSYDASNETIFFDPADYLDFITEFGNPNLPLLPLYDSSDRDYDDWFYLRKEWSIYSLFGYTVNQNSYLSSNERKLILAKLIDSGLTSVSETISFLKGVIRDHKSEKYQKAHDKWIDDLEFIKNYRSESDGVAIL